MSEDDVRRRCAAPTCPHQAVLGLPGAHDALRMDSPSQLEAAEEGSSLSTTLTALSSPGPALPRKSRTWWCEGDPRRAAQPRDIASSSNAFPCPDESASNSPGSHHRRRPVLACPPHRLHPSPSPLSSSPLSSSSSSLSSSSLISVSFANAVYHTDLSSHHPHSTSSAPQHQAFSQETSWSHPQHSPANSASSAHSQIAIVPHPHAHPSVQRASPMPAISPAPSPITSLRPPSIPALHPLPARLRFTVG